MTDTTRTTTDLPATGQGPIKRMSLFRPSMDKLTSGRKTVEVRAAYPSHRNLREGQLLRFISGRDECLTRIVRISEYGSLERMLDHEDPVAIGFDEGQGRDEVLADVREYCPPEKEALGVLAIEIEHADAA